MRQVPGAEKRRRVPGGGLTARRLRYGQGSHGRSFLRPRTHGFLQLPSLFLKCADGGARTGPRVPPGPQSASSQRHRGARRTSNKLQQQYRACTAAQMAMPPDHSFLAAGHCPPAGPATGSGDVTPHLVSLDWSMCCVWPSVRPFSSAFCINPHPPSLPPSLPVSRPVD